MKYLLCTILFTINLCAFDQNDIDKLLKDEECIGCDFSNADLSGKDLSAFDMSKSNFTGANLSNSNLFMADVQSCDFRNANLENTIFWKANLSFSNFVNTKAKGINLKGVNLESATIDNSDFSYSISWKAHFIDTIIKNTDFSYSQLGDAQFVNNDLTSSKLDNSILWTTQFENTMLTQKQCEEAKKEEAIFKENVQCIEEKTFQSYGHFKQMIDTRNITGKTTIDNLDLEQKGTYAVGALGSATGEITVFDGNIYLSYGKAGANKTLNHIPKGESAMLLALIRPNTFVKPIVIPEDMIDLDFYDWLETEAISNNIDISKPFLFILNGTFKELTWHIVYGRNIIPPKADEKHYLMEKIFVRKEKEEGTIFGIYRKGKQGVFTHPGDNYHAHGIFFHGSQAGHVDNFDLTKGMILQLAQ